jgi:hypothetical protein
MAIDPQTRQSVLDAIHGNPAKGIPIFGFNPMEWRMIDRLAGVPEGSYERSPAEIYRQMLIKSGVCALDQWIPDNPLTMRAQGFSSDTPRGSLTGAERIERDGILIDSPEAVVRHIEECDMPRIAREIAAFDEGALVSALAEKERRTQAEMGDSIYKIPYTDAMARFPIIHYGMYGYEQYFMAFALYPEVMEKHCALMGDYAVLYNRASAKTIMDNGLAPYIRIDHDITDSRGTLADVKALDWVWFTHFARCMEPFIKAGINVIWHCDGNVMQLVPRLIDIGFEGFQGFQYEDGVDYVGICRLRTKSGREPLIVGGVSVTRTLPYGTPADVKREMAWLVENGPKTRLFLGCSSSIAPGVPWENLRALTDGFAYYRQHEKGGN